MRQVQIRLYNALSKTSLNVLWLFLLWGTKVNQKIFLIKRLNFFSCYKTKTNSNSINKIKFTKVMLEKNFGFEVNFWSYLKSLMQVTKEFQNQNMTLIYIYLYIYKFIYYSPLFVVMLLDLLCWKPATNIDVF